MFHQVKISISPQETSFSDKESLIFRIQGRSIFRYILDKQINLTDQIIIPIAPVTRFETISFIVSIGRRLVPIVHDIRIKSLPIRKTAINIRQHTQYSILTGIGLFLRQDISRLDIEPITRGQCHPGQYRYYKIFYIPFHIRCF